MSRIHEALKRAELERANERAAAGGGNQPTATVAVSTVVDRSISSPNAAREGRFTFDDLLARRQAFADWNPDLQTDVFDEMQAASSAEQFRTLRSRLYQMRNDQTLKTLLVTSSMAGEGKTFVAGNLARSFARQHDRRVLVIDADLRRPRLHQVFGASITPGLTDYLRGKVDETAILQFGGSGNLCLIASGARVSDPSELLSNGRLKTLLDLLSPAFDWVLIDSPPCVPVADAGVIAQKSDGVLLVVRAAYTPSGVISRSRKELKGRNVVGVVLNAAEDKSLSYGSYYGGYGDAQSQASK